MSPKASESQEGRLEDDWIKGMNEDEECDLGIKSVDNGVFTLSATGTNQQVYSTDRGKAGLLPPLLLWLPPAFHAMNCCFSSKMRF